MNAPGSARRPSRPCHGLLPPGVSGTLCTESLGRHAAAPGPCRVHPPPSFSRSWFLVLCTHRSISTDAVVRTTRAPQTRAGEGSGRAPPQRDPHYQWLRSDICRLGQKLLCPGHQQPCGQLAPASQAPPSGPGKAGAPPNFRGGHWFLTWYRPLRAGPNPTASRAPRPQPEAPELCPLSCSRLGDGSRVP